VTNIYDVRFTYNSMYVYIEEHEINMNMMIDEVNINMIIEQVTTDMHCVSEK
jgi:hypothetical protein